MRFGSGLALAFALCACGGKVETNTLGAGSTGGIGCTSSTVTFQIDASINWCLGSPGSSHACSITIRGESGSLELAQQASECEASACGKPLPLPPFPILGSNTQLALEGSTLTWTGAQFVYATCGASAQECEDTQCTADGQYTIDMCGFRNPNPEWSDGCLEAGDQTPVTTFSTTFDYPASAPVLVTMSD